MPIRGALRTTNAEDRSLTRPLADGPEPHNQAARRAVIKRPPEPSAILSTAGQEAANRLYVYASPAQGRIARICRCGCTPPRRRPSLAR
jgi:hypothetical protein